MAWDSLPSPTAPPPSIALQPSYIVNPVGPPPGRPAPKASFAPSGADHDPEPQRRTSAAVHPYPPYVATPVPAEQAAVVNYYAPPPGAGYSRGEDLAMVAGSFRASFSSILLGAQPSTGLTSNPARVRLAANNSII